ncbi:MAG TPA: DUF2203 domain-containing protein [Anaerolineales bacterium]|nr:DUF2203 domain-containing protein [Anaerolineales bacterium]
MPRYFTLDEATATLAVIRPLLAEIQEIRQAILEKQPEVWPVLAKAAGNGGSQAANQVETEFHRLNQLVHRLQATGAVLKDIDLGLIDFPGLRDGREIYLCWKFDEDRIRYWHDLDSGFAGRQPL